MGQSLERKDNVVEPPEASGQDGARQKTAKCIRCLDGTCREGVATCKRVCKKRGPATKFSMELAEKKSSRTRV